MNRTRALTNTQIAQAALVVLLGFLASGVLGMVRLAVISAIFGASAELDSFYAAQRVPEVLFVLVAGGALGSSFIPVFSRFLAGDDETRAWRLASATMSLAAGAAAVLGIIIALAAPLIVPNVLVPGSDPAEQALTTALVRIMLLTTVIFAISGLMMGILNAHQNFLFPALALSMNNIGLIVGALVIAPMLGSREEPSIYGLAWGAVLGALLHLMIQIPGLRLINARLRWLLDWRAEGVSEVLLLMGPRVLGLAVVQINFVVNVAFASGMRDGSQTALTTSWTLMFFLLGIIAQSIGTAVFPTLSALVAENDLPGYRDRLASVMRSMLFLALPASVGLIVMGVPVIGTLFERGEWTVTATRATAWSLGFFALGIAGHSLLEVLSRAFYALSDTWTPVKIGIGAMVSNIILSIVFIQFVGDEASLARGPFAGLALANSLTTLVEAVVLWRLLSVRVGGINDRLIVRGGLCALIAAILMGGVVWLVDSQLVDNAYLIRLGAGAGVGVTVYFGLALVMGFDEMRALLRRFKLIRA